jgi:hypothetical protein
MSARRPIHPLAKYSFLIAIVTIPVSIISATFMPPFLPTLVGGGIAIAMGFIGCIAVFVNDRRFRGLGLSILGIVLGVIVVGLLLPST